SEMCIRDSRTPLGFVRGLGSAKDGTHHWWVQRVTSVMLIPLVIWFAIFVISIAHADYETFQYRLSHPFNAGAMIAFIVAAFYHASLGMQVIYEDYVRPESRKFLALLITQFLLFLLGTIAVVSVIKIAVAAV
ncbi:MAG: succinate dehydrogenase, hydrophobic membrane anchor protein, partial [Thermanaerothrix sp.]|nr:succinate dehydrogenase, hydrophobic membrane anchor protein [Thermanaerothrix sp.]